MMSFLRCRRHAALLPLLLVLVVGVMPRWFQDVYSFAPVAVSYVRQQQQTEPCGRSCQAGWLTSRQPSKAEKTKRQRLFLSSSGSDGGANKATLTDETTWNLRFILRGVQTKSGKKVDETFQVRAHFVEEEGYEPPQGSVDQIPGGAVGSVAAGGRRDDDRLVITKGRWKLSEDPNDRKDGLWVWGLFAEPLYPFMLLQLETAAVPLPPSGDDGEDSSADEIVPLQLYAQINHVRDRDTGNVVLEAGDVKVRQAETIKADPFGAATVDVYDEISVGTLSIQPVFLASTAKP